MEGTIGNYIHGCALAPRTENLALGMVFITKSNVQCMLRNTIFVSIFSIQLLCKMKSILVGLYKVELGLYKLEVGLYEVVIGLY